MLRAATLLTASSIAPLLAQGATWTLKSNLVGPVDKFLSGFDFVTDRRNHENAVYMSKAGDAIAKNLTSNGSGGTVILKADDFTNGIGNFEFGRDSLQLYSKDTLNKGSLVLIDAVHIPYGSVWPAIWLLGDPDQTADVVWPAHGEIDIVESANERNYNQYALHTEKGCLHPGAIDAATETGALVRTDCNSDLKTGGDYAGCKIRESDSTNSAGASFASNKGGVYAMLWDDTGIKTWFFQRSAIPQDISTTSPDPSKWTQKPTAFWPQSSCDTSKFFGPQTLVIDIAICGDFAGADPVWAETCAGSTGQPKCSHLSVTGDKSLFKNAYFELNYIKTFTASGSSAGSSSSTAIGSTSTSATRSTSSSASARTTGSSSATSASGTSAPSGAIKVQPLTAFWGLIAALPLVGLF